MNSNIVRSNNLILPDKRQDSSKSGQKYKIQLTSEPGKISIPKITKEQNYDPILNLVFQFIMKIIILNLLLIANFMVLT